MNQQNIFLGSLNNQIEKNWMVAYNLKTQLINLNP